MPRPGFTLVVDGATPPVAIWRNGHLTTEKLPIGSVVAYPPEPLTPVVDLREHIKASLESPIDSEPLSKRLLSGMKLTIAFDDITATDRALALPDPRGIALEEILTIAAEAQIDDVELVNARGLSRRMSKRELSSMLGPRITDSFVVTNLLSQHDASGEDLFEVSSSEYNEPIRLNKRIAESDLLIYLTLDPSDASAYRNIASRICGVTTIQSVISSGTTNNADVIGAAIEKQTPIFQVALSLNNAEFSGPTRFLQSRANEWAMSDRTAFRALRVALDLTPAPIRERVLTIPPSQQKVISVASGSVTATNKASLAVLDKQYGAEESPPADVLVLGAPPASPYAINSILNPLLAVHYALTTAIPVDGRRPFVKEGGVVILHHGLEKTFDPQEQTSFIDFFDRVLPIEQGDDLSKSEEVFATDAWYIHLYRTSYAHHGTLPFRLWAECERARSYLSGVIVVGGDVDLAHRMGFRRASTFADAVEMASDITSNANPSITMLPYPAPRPRATS